jgi:hypothetical protein
MRRETMNTRKTHALKLRALIAVVASISTLLCAQTPPAKPSAQEAAPTAPAAAIPAAPAKTFRQGVVKVGDEMKETLGRVTDLDKGDNGCFLILRNDRNGEIIELGKMEFCSQKQLKGKKVELEYKMETVQAASCYGDPKCKKTEIVPLVVGVKVLE